MPIYLNNLKNNLLFEFNQNFQINGLEDFRKSLEKNYFSEITFRQYSSHNESVNLVVEMDCNLSLVEVLYHFNKGNWGNFKSGQSTLINEVRTLGKLNDFAVDIEEFSINLKDTSIIIKKNYNQSIPEQFENIFASIGSHYVHFTRGLTEIPYEIYISVFEETAGKYSSLAHEFDEAKNDTENGFLKFWGMYYDSEEDGVIYDLENLCIVSGELYLLNL
ncbi:hypothetical protein [Kriegella aquimaris]|uniref:Uncharacterized protein n=1 Tax=Kriegella aquimaris TaxID=192904 RepID=A0A1G9K3V6_9FLAO|nr:hypothetical protein [Kriegella aquimaris]SDL44196.1 hypothetical protein SAMN04488514_101821 [Kriegella aquimaris]